jgi:hypothetical protein
MCFIPIVLTHWPWLRFVPYIWSGNTTHCGCNRSTEDAYSSLAPDLVYLEIRVCPILWFVFPTGLRKLTTVRYLCHFIHVVISTGTKCVPFWGDLWDKVHFRIKILQYMSEKSLNVAFCSSLKYYYILYVSNVNFHSCMVLYMPMN